MNVAQPAARPFVVWLALFTLVITLVVLAIVLIPKRIRPPQRAQCAVSVEPAGMQVWVDNGAGPIGQTRSKNELMTIELGVGPHRFVLRSPDDGSERSEDPRQRERRPAVVLTLKALPSAEPANPPPTVVDAGAAADARVRPADMATAPVDASAAPVAAPAQPNPAANPAPPTTAEADDDAAKRRKEDPQTAQSGQGPAIRRPSHRSSSAGPARSHPGGRQA